MYTLCLRVAELPISTSNTPKELLVFSSEGKLLGHLVFHKENSRVMFPPRSDFL